MCRIDGADSSEGYKEENRKARKTHTCCECGRSIGAGEKYRYTSMICERQPLMFKMCAHCLVGSDWLSRNCGGFVFCQVREELEEHAEEYPSMARQFQRIVVGMRRGWRRFDGAGLMSFPKMPDLIA